MFNFGVGTLIHVPLLDADGNAVTNPTPVRLAHMSDVDGDMSFDSKELYGQRQFALAVGRGKGKLTFKAKTADINAGALSNLFFGRSSTAGIRGVGLDLSLSASTTPTAPTIPNSGTFVQDLGVFEASTGKQYTRVASAPAAGQYTVNGTGQYAFNTGDAAKAMLISLEYTATSTTGTVQTITNDLMGYAPSFNAILTNKYQGKNLVLKLNNCVLNKHSLPFKNEDFSVADLEFQALADAAGNVGILSMF